MCEILLFASCTCALVYVICNYAILEVCCQEPKKDEEDIDEDSAISKWTGYEIHTAPTTDGVLPGVIRQLVIE